MSNGGRVDGGSFNIHDPWGYYKNVGTTMGKQYYVGLAEENIAKKKGLTDLWANLEGKKVRFVRAKRNVEAIRK